MSFNFLDDIQAELRFAETQISTILAIAADAIISLNEHMQIMVFNDGASAMFGPVLQRWSRVEGGTTGHLGYPTSNVHAVKEGQRAAFQHGAITWIRKTDTFRVVERN